MASKKRKGAKVGAKVGARVAPKAGRVAGKTAWKLGKGEAKLIRQAMSSREPRSARFVKYGFFALAGLAVGALISRSRSEDGSGASSRSNMTIEPERAAQYGRRASRESSVWYMGCLFTVLADSEETGGLYGLVETLAPKGAEPPRHIHSREDETFYVLEGEITFYVGDETYKATPGTFVSAPRGVPHSYTFENDVIRMLGLIAPAGFEEFFRPPQFSKPAQAPELPPPSEGPPDAPDLVATLEQYDIEVVGPPGAPE